MNLQLLISILSLVYQILGSSGMNVNQVTQFPSTGLVKWNLDTYFLYMTISRQWQQSCEYWHV